MSKDTSTPVTVASNVASDTDTRKAEDVVNVPTLVEEGGKYFLSGDSTLIVLRDSSYVVKHGGSAKQRFDSIPHDTVTKEGEKRHRVYARFSASGDTLQDVLSVARRAAVITFNAKLAKLPDATAYAAGMGTMEAPMQLELCPDGTGRAALSTEAKAARELDKLSPEALLAMFKRYGLDAKAAAEATTE